ncbi:polyprenyl synthetase family protein [Mammaliicoccus stepanovicii]|uniref:Heptaprenyl diphosphate synthase component II n=1 Tax=Mammaliicoccus stepanovicii TaxID=643214 RepID=A0A239Z9S5_9STAP|nr:polyprenyl synthetase family protein [Mammaliicoccus stepanovicii]PNZ72671.1 heptaprenyl diphosphate synthase [Mammaliicoccus stepanovicii]GGI39854.1 heptaprenyl diphosphate synthase subunit II [Mammaliicoccus stepanovicii]SNV67446.1 Heptaprenyl diphosphate synthase component II [Mammaliicoccus stepanovicii]
MYDKTMINLNKEVKEVEKLLNSFIDSDQQTINDACRYLLSSGGKRIRPLFTLIASQFGDSESNDVRTIATTLELIHMASLVHDDVIDKSDKRRGKPTISKKWDVQTAVLTGNYLLSQSLNAVSRIEHPKLHERLADGIIEVCKGELFQFEDQFVINQSITNYLRRIKRKTALLISLSTELGAYSANTDDITAEKLKKIGYYIGMSYQIIDDILDFTSTEKKLGKPVGSDLRNGHLTLPVLLRMKNSSQFKNKITQLDTATSSVVFDEIIEEVIHSQELQHAKSVSNNYLKKAEDLIHSLKNEQGKKLLFEIINKISDRNH